MPQPRDIVVRLNRQNEFVRNNIQDLVALGRQQGSLPEPPPSVARRGEEAINNWYMTRANELSVRVARDELESGRIARDEEGRIQSRRGREGGDVPARAVLEPNRGQGGLLVSIPSYAAEREGTATAGPNRPRGLRAARTPSNQVLAGRNARARELGFTSYGQQRTAARLGYPATTEGVAAYRAARAQGGRTPRYNPNPSGN